MNNLELAASQISQAIANLRRERTAVADNLIVKLSVIQQEANQLAESTRTTTVVE